MAFLKKCLRTNNLLFGVCLDNALLLRWIKKDNVKICLRMNNLLFGICLDYLELMLFRLLFRKTVKSNFLQPPASTKFSGFR